MWHSGMRKIALWIVLVQCLVLILVLVWFSNVKLSRSVPSGTVDKLRENATWSVISLLRTNTCDVSKLEPWNRGPITKLLPAVPKDCGLLKQHDEGEIELVRTAIKKWKNSETLVEWMSRMRNCSAVVKEFSNNFYVSQEELDFPLAFILLVYNNPQQIVRFLKAIYRPQNLYCIHADARQGNRFADIFRGLSTCLGNVFVSSKLEKVYYEHHTILDAQLNCLRDLRTFNSKSWRYAITLSGKELPLKTNREIVSTLKSLNGLSVVQSKPLEQAPEARYRFKWKAFLEKTFTGKVLYNFLPLAPPPHGLKIYKGPTFVAATRQFADFLLGSVIAKDFHKYLQDVKVPEEHFYTSLYHSANASAFGGYRENATLPCINYVPWRSMFQCEGRRIVHNLCIATVADLNEIHQALAEEKQEYFFFNKYFMEQDHVVMDCMEEQLLQQNRREYQRDCKMA